MSMTDAGEAAGGAERDPVEKRAIMVLTKGLLKHLADGGDAGAEPSTERRREMKGIARRLVRSLDRKGIALAEKAPE